LTQRVMERYTSTTVKMVVVLVWGWDSNTTSSVG
jgi:hypothetical protein